MAKKPKKEAVKPDEPQPAPAPVPVKGITPVKGAVGKASGKAQPVPPPVVVVPPPPPPPVVEPVKKVKRPRFVREKKEKQPAPAPAAPLPARSTKVTAKLMTKGLVVPPKDDPATGQKPRA